MNQNRCWPGVPNRYSISSSSSVIRPKSIATVVVVLCGVADRSSTPTLAEVITASVRSGVISDTDPTKVVLPDAEPSRHHDLRGPGRPALRAVGDH